LGACVFCRIVAGQGPARLLLSDDHTLAFLSIAPATPGHTLVVPRRHVVHFHLHVVPRYHPDELQIMWQADPPPTRSWTPCTGGCWPIGEVAAAA